MWLNLTLLLMLGFEEMTDERLKDEEREVYILGS